MGPFVHLHTHTMFSLLDGALRIPEVLDAASRAKMPAVAITDHGNMFGVVQFYQEALKRGVKPILGCEVYLAPKSRFDRPPGGQGEYYHLVLLAENEKGYKNLIKLVSAGYVEGFYYRPRIDKELLAAQAEGLIGLSACLKGEVLVDLAHEKPKAAEMAAREYESIFGKGNFFLEIQDHGLADQKRVNPELVRLSEATGIPLVATNDVHYLRKDDEFAHDVLLCIQTGKNITDTNRLRYTSDQFFFKSPVEMEALFGSIPQALENTVRIAERCNVKIETGKMFLPKFKPPTGLSSEEYFRKTVEEGFAERETNLLRLEKEGRLHYPISDYRKRLEEEMAMVVRMKFPGYFLVVWDFIRHARQKGIPVGPGRGSAAGSLIAYSLGITDIDPIQYNLLFERFLNPERITMPDIDIDFCQQRRGEVIEYVTEKYGRDNVAQIITFDTMAARAAIRDVGRVMGIPYSEVDQLAKLVPAEIGITLEEALKTSPALRQAGEATPEMRKLLEVARRLEGLTRHASVHAAGVVIAPSPITDYLPLYKSGKDEITTQFAMKEVEKIGLLKMDFLGLKTLTVLHDALQMIRETAGVKVELEGIPLDDAATYKLFAAADTGGIFQFESSGMRDILRRLQPNVFEDLIALNALYRPGPIQSGMIDDYIKRRRGEETGKAILPEIEDILEETHGVIVYQEQVMQIARRLAGFTLGEADILRRAMGKKVSEEMKAQKDKFVAGSKKNKIPERKAEEVFDLMEKFASYGFNKSHSAAYALLAYQTAYLKAHYPVQFMAAMLTHEMEDSDKMVKYIHECREMGIEVLPPDINESDRNFTVVGAKKIRFGLGAIKQVGQGAVEAILAARKRVGRLTSVFQFCHEVELRAVNKRVFENLVKSGTMDTMGLRRSQAFALIDKAVENAQRVQKDRQAGQGSLFGGDGGETVFDGHTVPELEEWKDHEKLGYEKETLGFYITGHPLMRYEEELGVRSNANTSTLADLSPDSEVFVGGILAVVKRTRTKSGKMMATLWLEDLHGMAEIKVFPQAYEQTLPFLEEGKAVLVSGRIESNEKGRTLIASTLEPLERLREKIVKQIELNLAIPALDEDFLLKIRQALEAHRGPIPVVLKLTRSRNLKVFIRPNAQLNISPTRKALEDLADLVGQDAVRCIY